MAVLGETSVIKDWIGIGSKALTNKEITSSALDAVPASIYNQWFSKSKHTRVWRKMLKALGIKVSVTISLISRICLRPGL